MSFTTLNAGMRARIKRNGFEMKTKTSQHHRARLRAYCALLLLLICFTLAPAQSTTDPGEVITTNRQSGTTYTVKSSDRKRVVIFTNAGTKAVTLPIFSSGWYGWFCNTGAGAATITPASGTIGGSGTLVLAAGSSAKIVRDSTGYVVTQKDLSTAQLAVIAAAGNVSGPASAVDNHLAVFSGTTGKIIADGGAIPAGTVVTSGSPTSGQPAGFSGATTISPATATVIESVLFCADAGASDVYACNLAPAIASYVTGTHYRFKANTANSGVASINFNTRGALPIKKAAGGITTDLADNDIQAGQWVDCVYDGTNCQMQSGLGNAPPAGLSNSAPSGTVPKSVDGSGNLGAGSLLDDGAGALSVGAGVPLSFTAGAGSSLFLNNAMASIGDALGNGNATAITTDDTAKTITSSAGTESIIIDGTAHAITATAAAKISLNGATGVNVQGTSTNDNAASGFVGELLTASLASGSATSLTTATAKTIISVDLTAGDWDVWAVADFVPAATTTTAVVSQGISTTNNTLDGQDTFTAASGGNLSGTILGSLIAENTPIRRISIASTTTVYLVAKATFAVSTMTGYGSIFARRVR